jgi:hypothetical protein
VGFKELFSGVPTNSVGDSKYSGVFQNIYRSGAAIKKPVTGRKRRGRGRGSCVDW